MRLLPLLLPFLFLSCTSPEDRCEAVVDDVNACVAAVGSSAAINATATCASMDAVDLDDIECMEEAMKDAECTQAGLESLLYSVCACDPSACSGGDTDTGGTTYDTGYYR